MTNSSKEKSLVFHQVLTGFKCLQIVYEGSTESISRGSRALCDGRRVVEVHGIRGGPEKVQPSGGWLEATCIRCRADLFT